jgi:hypothetical protein
MSKQASTSNQEPRNTPAHASCLRCGHFLHAPAQLEAALPGLSSLSSAHAAVRGDDGICAVHDRYVSAASVCAAFAPTAVAA